MLRWSVLAAVAAIGLVVAPAADPVALPGTAPAGPVVPVADVTSDSPAPLAPCPHLTPPTIPPTPTTPAHDPATPVMGGPQLNTTGLAVPSGVPAPPVTSAMSWVVADLDTGAVLAACDPHLRRRPASVQKLLLAETALPKLDPNEVVEATAADLDLPKDSSAVGLIVGGQYPVSTLWYGLLLESGNDAADALARVAGGTAGLPGTVAAMNTEAHRLGADDTHAVTPSGLDAPDQYTSSYDLALIARADFARPDFVQYDTMLRFQWPAQPPKDPKGFQIQNENKLLTNYPGALGGKTGFTNEARHTYVGAAQRNGRRLVVTLMGAEIVPTRAEGQGETLLNWAFSLPAAASVGHLVTPDEAATLYKASSPSANPGVARLGAVDAAAGNLSGTVTLTALVALPLLALGVIGLAVIRRGARRS